MRIAAIVCNVVLLVLTGVTVLTEGVPGRAGDVVLTFLVLLVPLLTASILVRERLAGHRSHAGDGRSPTATLAHRAAGLCNVMLLGATGWASVARYPYSEGNGIIPFAVLAVGTPIVSLVALLDGRTRAMHEERGSAAGVSSPVK